MPNQEEEKSSRKPAAKARPILKQSSTSDWDFAPIEHRQWIDIETQEPMVRITYKCQNSSLDYFDTVNKFIEKKMEQSIATKLLMNARRSNPTIQDIGQAI